MLLNMADSHYRKGHHSGERRLAREALTVSRDASWPAGEALALAVLGRSYWSVGATGLANRYLCAALRIHESVGDLAGQANALGRLARNAYDAGDPVSALRDFRSSLVLAERAGSRFGQIRLPAYIALSLRLLGRYEEADHWCGLAIRASREMDFHEGMAIALTCRASLMSDLGEHTRAVTTAREAHVTMPHLSDPRIEADCLIGLGGVEAAAGQTDLAMRSFGQALLISEEIHYWQGAARAQAESAAAYVRLGLYEEALAAGRRARRVLHRCDMRLVTAQTLASEADCALAAGDIAAAIAGHRRAAALHRAAGHPLGEVRARCSPGAAPPPQPRATAAPPAPGAARCAWLPCSACRRQTPYEPSSPRNRPHERRSPAGREAPPTRGGASRPARTLASRKPDTPRTPAAPARQATPDKARPRALQAPRPPPGAGARRAGGRHATDAPRRPAAPPAAWPRGAEHWAGLPAQLSRRQRHGRPARAQAPRP